VAAFVFLGLLRGDKQAVSKTVQTTTASSSSTAKTSTPEHAAVSRSHIPIGDGKVSTDGGKVGYVYECKTPRNVGGAEHAGAWLKDGYWDATAKATVDGAVQWPNATYSVTTQGTYRVLSGNGLPLAATTGVYPISRGDDAYSYDRNPNSIVSQQNSYRIPLSPVVTQKETCANMGAVGFMKNGVAIYNALDAAGRDAAAHEVQDSCDGHPQSVGEYHYHNLSQCIPDPQTGKHSGLLGYAFDGFGIYGNYGERGESLTNEDLDICHGHTHRINWDGTMVEMYHYHATWRVLQ
jgi:hypothetical protein